MNMMYNNLALHLKKNSDFYILNGLSIAFYFIIFSQLSTLLSSHVMFSSEDSLTYYRVSNWITDCIHTKDTAIRPFLYPLLISLIYKTIGPIGFWLFQFFGWLASINFLFFSIKKVVKVNWIAMIAAIVILLNISFLVLTLHALTEVITITLLTYILFYICSNLSKVHTIHFFHRVLFIFVLLAVIKPLFFPISIILLVAILPLFYRKKYMAAPKKLFYLFLILIPVFIQFSIMFVRHDTFSFSTISGKTFDEYLLTQGLEYKNNMSHYNAREKVRAMSSSEKMTLLKDNKSMYFDLYCENLKYNIKALPTFLSYPKEFKNKQLTKFMESSNEFYYYLHFWMIIPTLLLLLISLFRKEFVKFGLTLFLASLVYYILLTSGISYWQGDRLVIIALPLWIALYLFVLFYWFTYASSFFKYIKQSRLK